MKYHRLLLLLASFALLSCVTQKSKDPKLYVSGYYMENYNIPINQFLEVESDSLRFIYLNNETSTGKKPANNKDTISTKNGMLVMQKRPQSLFLQSLKKDKTKEFDLTFFPVIETKKWDKNKIFNQLLGQTFETRIDRTLSSPNSDLDIKKTLTFSKDSILIAYHYFLDNQLMYAENEKIAYKLIEKNDYLFFEFDSSDFPDYKRINQIVALNKHSFTFNIYKDREATPEIYIKTESKQLPKKSFKPCRDSRPGEYYHNHIKYAKGNNNLMNKIRENAPLTTGNGYITIHFTINCNKEIGRFGIEQMNTLYEPTTYNPELIKHLINEIALLKDWPDLKLDKYYQDIHAFLMFKIKDGKIIDVCP